MIRLSALNNKPFLLNALLIETVEEVPHTVITLSSGKKYVVKETLEEVQKKAIVFLQQAGWTVSTAAASGGENE